MHPSLISFNPAVRAWFEKNFEQPSPPQIQGWPSIAGGNHTLIVAPTGSGKTLAAFLWCINALVEEHETRSGDPVPDKSGVRVLYVSPLKALNNDIHRNLEIPLNGIHQEAASLGISLPRIRAELRTGDTTQTQRQALIRKPPEILITTPESLYLMLSSAKARKIFTTVRYVIIDEIHAISNNKRGVHLSLSLERLEAVAQAEPVRIGLSATQKPLESIAQYLGGLRWNGTVHIPRPVQIIDAGQRKRMDLQVVCPAQDLGDLPPEGVWNFVYPRLVRMIGQHKTTLIFVNSRRLAERLAVHINDLLTGSTTVYNLMGMPQPVLGSQKTDGNGTSGERLVQAYHSSMSRSARQKMETDLKKGRLRVLVSTSALELGIDIGSIDLVVQIQSPKGIARGLQRVGRSGHLVQATSKGRMIPTHRDDLIESVVISREMINHNIETTCIPENCLDILAQHIAAMVGVEKWQIDDLWRLIRGSYCYRNLAATTLEQVIAMLAGRYTHEAFRELRARISWDKVHRIIRSLPGTSRLAITSGGAIPDRGYYSVYIEDGRTKIGELDEEFIYESRVGDTFLLGTHVWRIAEIESSRIIATPAPGQPARMPFWRGEQIGRRYDLGNRIGAFLEEVASRLDRSDLLTWLTSEYPIDSTSAWNVAEYVRNQRSATGVVPNHRTIVMEGFRDEIGDPRIVVHSQFGRSINALLSFVLLHQFRQRTSIDVQMLYNDQGLLIRCSDADRLPLDLFSNLDPDQAEKIVLDDLTHSPLFGSLFRQNAARALLLPKVHPGKRTPLWLQRLRAGDLLQVARQFEDFPIIIETVRECLTDILDFDTFKSILHRIADGDIRIVTVANETPSPFAASILFDFVATYLYEWDEPKGDLSLKKSLVDNEALADLMKRPSFRPLINDEALKTIEHQIQYTAETRRARSAEELLEIFLRLGELSRDEITERCAADADELFRQLTARHSIVPISLGDNQYFIATEEMPIYLRLASVDPDIMRAIPEEYTKPSLSRTDALIFLFFRQIQTHSFLPANKFIHRYGLPTAECTSILELLRNKETVKQEERNGEQFWCYQPNLERLHRASLAIRRKEIRPASLSQYTDFLIRWQHLHPGHREQGETGTEIVLNQFIGLSLPTDLWEKEILARRIRNYNPGMLRSHTGRGECIAVGAGSGKLQWLFRGTGNIVLNEPSPDPEILSSDARTIYDLLKEHGASFLDDLRSATEFSLRTINRLLAELFWAGFITNDLFDEILNVRRYRSETEPAVPVERIALTNPHHNPFRSAAMKSARAALKNTPGWNGRWSIVHSRAVMGKKISEEERISCHARQLLIRYGIVAREIARREHGIIPWSLLSIELQRMELRGEIRRGFFVQGLSGMQYALPNAMEELEKISTIAPVSNPPLVINSCDPANPYGLGIDVIFDKDGAPLRIVRASANFFVMIDGTPILWIENFGARISTNTSAGGERINVSFAAFTSHMQIHYHNQYGLTIEFIDDVRPSQSSWVGVLQSLGFFRDKVQTMRLEW